MKGQIEIATYSLICDEDLRALGLDTWSRVRWRDVDYDVAAPPLYHHGATRHVRHWSAEIRQRPREVGSG
ncbi:hypothetical protein EDD28_0069 [Salana multivorans]|uniref:Uncharacterized protein n=1 Tax=Salana multivorans TaxID=120377 RepID=A0A3N2D6W8_9MICO|nr:hypothetical protein EDD28_0069 [Salana multivorans]